MKGGLGSLAEDPSFVSAARQEMAEAMQTPLTDIESVARAILNKRSASGKKKRRPIPVPPSAPAVTVEETDEPDPAVRRKRRPIPRIPAVQEHDSRV